MATSADAYRLVDYPVAVDEWDYLELGQQLGEPNERSIQFGIESDQEDVEASGDMQSALAYMAAHQLGMHDKEEKERTMYERLMDNLRAKAVQQVGRLARAAIVVAGKVVKGAMRLMLRAGVFLLRGVAWGLIRLAGSLALRVMLRFPLTAGVALVGGAAYAAYKHWTKESQEVIDAEDIDFRERPQVRDERRVETPAPSAADRERQRQERRHETERRQEPESPTLTEQHTFPKGKFAESMLPILRAEGMTDQNEIAMFLAQVSHESNHGKWLVEKWDPAKVHWQQNYEPPSRTATNLGNTEPGDGFRFRGRGYIQLTGRWNYTAAGKYIGVDLANNPDLAARHDIAVKAALWYWRVARKRIPELARKGDVEGVTYQINTKGLHMDERKALYRGFLKRLKEGTLVELPSHAMEEEPTPTRTSSPNTPSNKPQAVASLAPARSNAALTPFVLDGVVTMAAV